MVVNVIRLSTQLPSFIHLNPREVLI